MNGTKKNELIGLITSIALAIVVAALGVMALGGWHRSAEGVVADPLSIELQNPDQAGTVHVKKGIERFHVTDVQALPSSTGVQQ